MTPRSTSTITRIKHPQVLLLARLACGLFMAAYAVLFGIALAKSLQIHEANAFGIATRWTFEGELRLNPYASSPAAQAGIRAGDILVAFNGQPVENGFTLVSEPGVPAVLGVRGEDGILRAYTLTPHEHPLAFADVLLRLGIPRDIGTAIALTIAFATLLCFWGVGLLMFWRRSDNPMSLLLAVVLWGAGLRFIDPLTLVLRLGSAEQQLVAYALSSLLNVSAYLFFLAFPSGRLLRRWMLGLLALFAVYDTITVLTIYNQLRIGTYLTGLGIFYGIVIALLIWRYRRHFTLTERLQTRWFILSLIIVLLSYIVSTFLTTFTMLGMSERSIILIIARLGFLVVPFLIAFSILRYRLYEVDLVINRSLVYGALTVVLLALFVLGFFAVQTAVQLLTHGEQPTIAAGIAILVVLLSFYPTRSRLQHFVDRRFFGLRMDLEQLEKRARLDALDAKGTPGGLTGKRLGEYELGMLFARGGMGELYLGKHVKLGKTIAIKVMPSELASKEEFRARFEREAKIVAALGHPNIVNTFDYGVEADTFYMVMDYIDGQELADIVRQGAIAHADARPILRDVASALDYVHAHGLVHRDIKPSNVMLRTATGAEQQRAILMDFGIAKSLGDESSLTQTGLVGTVDYAAPEQIMSARDVTTQADIYSLGVMAYQMLTGELPFKGSIGQIVFAHMQQPPPDPRSINASIPDTFANAIMRAMSKDASVRFATAGEFSAALGTELPAALSA